jgi:UTP--glucose-1-phosphate uridylyltransferase
MSELKVDDETRRLLAPYGFDEAQLRAFAARAGAPSTSNAVTGELTPPGEGDVVPLPAEGTQARARLAKRGRAAIERGEVAVVVLAGGMATRFGGVVKAVVPVIDGRSFLELKLLDVAEAPRVPVAVMSSFATHERILAHVQERRLRPLEVFPQFVSLRLTPQGGLFREADGRPSPYATGHGDFSFALRHHGVLRRFLDAGVKVVAMSNVDNLGATLDPALVGLHLELGGKLTAEVVRKEKGDKGGAPARLDGVPQIIEGFRFPPGFDQDCIPVFNTNTLLFDAAALDRDFALPFYRVEKQVDGRPAIQFERLVGELTAFLPTRFVEVPREGAAGRFLPAKDPEELERRLADIRLVVESKRWLR